MTERRVESQGFWSEQLAVLDRHRDDLRKLGVQYVLEERSRIRFGYVKFEKIIRYLNGIVKLDGRIWSSGTRLGDRNLRTLKYLEHGICARRVS